MAEKDGKELYKKTLTDQIYEVLYKSIIAGEILSGQELVEHQLSREFNISRTPIREAFNRLKAIGLVEGNNYSKVMVKGFSREEIEEVYDIRTLLETYSIEKAIENFTEEDIVFLEDILKQAYDHIMSGNVNKVVEINTIFHEKINRISGKKQAIKMLNSLRDIIIISRVSGNKDKDFSLQVYQSHLRLVQAIKNKDKMSAVAEIKKHMEESKQTALSSMHLTNK